MSSRTVKIHLSFIPGAPLEIISEHSENGSTEADEACIEDYEMMNTT